MNTSFLLRPALIAALAGLASCGGGGGDGPAVTSLQASPAMFGRTTTVQVQGVNLQNVTASIEPGCTTMTRGATGTDTFQTFSCRLSWLGDLRVRVRSEGGAELAALRLDITLPQVTFTAAQGTGASASTGSFTVELDPEKAPGTVDNFLAYVNQSTCFYRNTLFHRVDVPQGVVQAGGFTANLTTKLDNLMPFIALETNRGLSNLRGTIGMARGSDPNSATSQFYINLRDNKGFDYVSPSQPGYAVFGKVIGNGMTDIDRLATVPVAQKGQFPTAPVTEVVITGCSQTK
jgi:cyclophilin family peptidyl-prolyl cis-trans isomerase